MDKFRAYDKFMWDMMYVTDLTLATYPLFSQSELSDPEFISSSEIYISRYRMQKMKFRLE
jgi:hypothetical protein